MCFGVNRFDTPDVVQPGNRCSQASTGLCGDGLAILTCPSLRACGRNIVWFGVGPQPCKPKRCLVTLCYWVGVPEVFVITECDDHFTPHITLHYTTPYHTTLHHTTPHHTTPHHTTLHHTTHLSLCGSVQGWNRSVPSLFNNSQCIIGSIGPHTKGVPLRG